MLQRFKQLMVGFSFGLLAASHVGAQEPPTPPPIISNLPMEPEPVRGWLDEVRAQRQAREQRRHAAKEAMDARRRWIDPWGAAQQEAREQEVQRRRDAFLQKIEREREVFRNQIPWTPQDHPWQGEIAEPAPEFPIAPETDSGGTPGQALPSPSPYALPGWDNHWYYRGY